MVGQTRIAATLRALTLSLVGVSANASFVAEPFVSVWQAMQRGDVRFPTRVVAPGRTVRYYVANARDPAAAGRYDA